jgi:hypothetical protein
VRDDDIGSAVSRATPIGPLEHKAGKARLKSPAVPQDIALRLTAR